MHELATHGNGGRVCRAELSKERTPGAAPALPTDPQNVASAAVHARHARRERDEEEAARELSAGSASV